MATLMNSSPGNAPNTTPTQGTDERSLGELFADLARETTALVRQEVQLAKTEMSHKAASVAKHAVLIAAGGLIAYAGFVVLLVGIAFLLTQAGLPFWAAALLVGLIVAGAGGIVAFKGLNGLKQADPVPHQTLETLKEDAQWAKDQTR